MFESEMRLPTLRLSLILGILSPWLGKIMLKSMRSQLIIIPTLLYDASYFLHVSDG